MSGIFISKDWKIEPITKEDTFNHKCKICNNSQGVRYLVIPKNNNSFGVFLCEDCLSHIVILINMENKRAGCDFDYLYATNDCYKHPI